MKPNEMRRLALKLLEEADQEGSGPEELSLLVTAEQILIAADAFDEMAIVEIKPGTIIGERVGGDPADEAEHYQVCPACGQTVDMRDLDAVLHHEREGHEPLPSN
ncbi:MAG: hypothetical protein JWL84_2623 [Rhodospirillales bacterium]|nr:hypothetical protein [Rhodospirillales bacterium]